eukprot:CAMPEP_0172699184 /NCGR_PEP_ID=MMETSP1074-20121228/30008_1 /TAXON_ID=2916 /ORGANISM="Ceratium fusus, Strain PA161109" /LENGTH=376 /DNA_ID=CAMNT_0013520353 /DNA_START=137 /DNA_END=1264 /DNA_ORIENTATION=-
MFSSGNRGGAERLRQNQAQLHKTKLLVIERDQEFEIQTEELLESVGRQTREAHTQRQEAHDVLQLQRELASVAAAHAREFNQQREQLQNEHERMLHQRLEIAYEEGEFVSADGDCGAALATEIDASWAEREDATFVEQVEEAEVRNLNLIRKEELRTDSICQELSEANIEIRVLTQERDSEAEAASVTKEAFNAERRAALRQGEMLRAEARAHISEAEAARDAHRDLQQQLRDIQREISCITHVVGQRNQELRMRDSELRDVQEGLLSIQDKTDAVNQELQERCDHVRRIEGSLQLTRELGDRVHCARGMLKESHDALAQLGCLLQQERSHREDCAQSLRQQQSQTELLMHLLRHFRCRAQELAPQALLATRSGRV